MSSDQPPAPEPQATRARAWAPCVCMLLALLSVLLAPVLMFVVWNGGNAREVQRRLAKVRDAGLPTNSAELEQYYRLPEGIADTTQLWLDGMQPLTTEQFEQDVNDIPIVGSTTELPLPGEPWPDIERAEALLQKYAASLEMFHAAADQGGAARFPTNFSQGISMRLDHAENLRAAARLLKLEAYVRAHRGDARGCAASIRAMFGVRRSLEQEPILVSNMVCIGLHGIATFTLADTITTVPFTDDELQTFQRELRSIDHRSAVKRAVIGERVIGSEVFQNPSIVQSMTESPVPIPVMNSDRALHLEIFEGYMAALEKDFPECRTAYAAVDQKIRQVAGQPVGKLGHIFTLLLTPAIGAAVDATARGTADGRAADAAIAAELFRRKHNRLPKNLAELVPEYLPQVPQDPFDGQPLRYEVRQDGFVIYSIGRDGKDGGGNMDEPRTDEVLFVPIRRPHP